MRTHTYTHPHTTHTHTHTESTVTSFLWLQRGDPSPHTPVSVWAAPSLVSTAHCPSHESQPQYSLPATQAVGVTINMSCLTAWLHHQHMSCSTTWLMMNQHVPCSPTRLHHQHIMLNYMAFIINTCHAQPHGFIINTCRSTKQLYQHITFTHTAWSSTLHTQPHSFIINTSCSTTWLYHQHVMLNHSFNMMHSATQLHHQHIMLNHIASTWCTQLHSFISNVSCSTT